MRAHKRYILISLITSIAIIGTIMIFIMSPRSTEETDNGYAKLNNFINTSTNSPNGSFNTKSIHVVDKYWFIIIDQNDSIAVINSGPEGLPSLLISPFLQITPALIEDLNMPKSVTDKVSELGGWSYVE